MSKIYEALQNVQRQKKGDALPNVPVPFAPPVPEGLGLEDEMLGLYKIVDALLSQSKSKIVQFIGAREGEGTSTIVREFARVVANLVGLSVLLLDADRHHPSQDRFFDIRNACCWHEMLKNERPPEDVFYRIGQSRLFVGPSCNSASFTPEVFDSRFDNMCQNLRTDFDLVLIDAAPLTVSADGLAIASKVDGVILVVEAEKTRWQTVKRLRDSISRVGGNILGVVLNKRRYYIPQFIYKYL
jgi:capsular exopolysaccharide synthesis family protein